MAIQHLMRLVVYADTLANIQADIGTLDELVFGVDTATGYLYHSRDDGTTWVVAGGGGTVTSVTGTAPISVATGTTTPVISHDASGVTAGTYGSVTVDAKGHVTAGTTPDDNDHLHGLFRFTGDGATTTFDLPDYAEYLELVFNAGSAVDPLGVTLSSDGGQLTFSAAPTAANVLQGSYVVARV